MRRSTRDAEAGDLDRQGQIVHIDDMYHAGGTKIFFADEDVAGLWPVPGVVGLATRRDDSADFGRVRR